MSAKEYLELQQTRQNVHEASVESEQEGIFTTGLSLVGGAIAGFTSAVVTGDGMLNAMAGAVLGATAAEATNDKLNGGLTGLAGGALAGAAAGVGVGKISNALEDSKAGGGSPKNPDDEQGYFTAIAATVGGAIAGGIAAAKTGDGVMNVLSGMAVGAAVGNNVNDKLDGGMQGVMSALGATSASGVAVGVATNALNDDGQKPMVAASSALKVAPRRFAAPSIDI